MPILDGDSVLFSKRELDKLIEQLARDMMRDSAYKGLRLSVARTCARDVIEAVMQEERLRRRRALLDKLPLGRFIP